MKWILAVLIALPLAHAQVVLSQVLYDPLGTETGGEAIELRNMGTSAVDISGWTIATESTLNDAKIPENTVLFPGSSYLIADKGWSEKKDNPSWRSADIEEALTMSNSDSGVALMANGTIVDAIGWGNQESIENNLFEGTPVSFARDGYSLIRIDDSDDNAKDVIESPADFFEGMLVPITADVTLSVPIIEIPKVLKIAPEGLFTVKNNGESAVLVTLAFNEFRYKNNTLPKEALRIDGPSEFTLEAQSEQSVRVRIQSGSNTIPGKYVSTVRVIVKN